MDFLLVFGVAMLVTVFIGTAVYFIMTFGTKEKTYEEAILEQRARSEADAAFLGKSAKEKQKEKKLKKAGKKVKEKAEKAAAKKEAADSISNDETEHTSHHKNQHVVFDTEPAIIDEPAPSENLKDESSDAAGKRPVQKLIEKSVPSRREAPKPERQSAAKAEKPAVVEVVEKQERPAPAQAAPKRAAVLEAAVGAPVPSKGGKKKRAEAELPLEKMALGPEGINASLLEPLILKAELSRSEIQNLIDLLLNKQQGSETEVAEWNEGRQDPMMKLKKAFAEKEKALQEELDASLALQNKLKEVRGEFNQERSRFIAANKLMEEKLLSRTNEVAAATAKFHHEKQTLTQQLQQLKHQLDQEHQVIRKFQEELAQAQNALQTQQQLEPHVANLTVQLHTRDQQIVVLQKQIAENQATVQQCELLSAQVAQLQEQLKNAQNSSQGEVHSKQKQLAEMKAAKEEIERQLSMARQREGQANSELNKLKEVATQKQSELDKLAAEVAKLREENEGLTSQVSLVSQLQSETRQLREENESLAAQVTAVTERPAAEGRENGDVTEEKHADAKLASAQLINDLRDRDIQVEELLEQVKQGEKSASTTIDLLTSQINTHKHDVAQLKNELEQQRKKNDELRSKNYKVMDALAAAETMFQSKIQETDKLVHDTGKTIKEEEERKARDALQRLFPSISVEEKVHDEWVAKFSSAANQYVTELRSREPHKQQPDEDQPAVIAELEKRNAQLSGMVTNYKRIIEDTEGMLNKLQQHVEAEETKWQQQLADKEAELMAVIRERDELHKVTPADESSVVQTQLEELQNKLQIVEAEKRSLKSELESSKGTLSTIEKLKDERNRLSTDLASEQAKAEEQLNQLAKLKILLVECESAAANEKANAQQLREEIEKLRESQLAAPATPVAAFHNGSTNGPSSAVETASTEKAAKKKNLSGWLKKKVVGASKSPQHSPNLSARGDDFLTNERLESS